MWPQRSELQRKVFESSRTLGALTRTTVAQRSSIKRPMSDDRMADTPGFAKGAIGGSRIKRTWTRGLSTRSAVCVVAPGAVTMPWRHEVAAITLGFLPGQVGVRPP